MKPAPLECITPHARTSLGIDGLGSQGEIPSRARDDEVTGMPTSSSSRRTPRSRCCAEDDGGSRTAQSASEGGSGSSNRTPTSSSVASQRARSLSGLVAGRGSGVRPAGPGSTERPDQTVVAAGGRLPAGRAEHHRLGAVRRRLHQPGGPAGKLMMPGGNRPVCASLAGRRARSGPSRRRCCGAATRGRTSPWPVCCSRRHAPTTSAAAGPGWRAGGVRVWRRASRASPPGPGWRDAATPAAAR